MPTKRVPRAPSEDAIDVTTLLVPVNNSNGKSHAIENNSSIPGVHKHLALGDGHNSEVEAEELLGIRHAESTYESPKSNGKNTRKGSSFQSMGLDNLLLKAISRKGFSVPTPIQRKIIPVILEGRDVVGMARTGSGKTAAFMIPMIQKLKIHSAQVGARAVVLSPSRELAIQTLKVLKELGKGTGLRSVLLVGGDSLEEDFSSMITNPDIIIATPGRFWHLKVEMNLDFSSVQYLVFDEADRLFEMGFSSQLNEIINALPSTRQTMLFSATLPSSLVEFARAGLQDPQLVRLDAESKISPDLSNAFFNVKPEEKDGALMFLLQQIVGMPTGTVHDSTQHSREPPNGSKGKQKKEVTQSALSYNNHSTLIFVPTKHHVEYLVALLRLQGFTVSLVYGSLDQTARKENVEMFRKGMTNILVVTDVAARGIDIPILANVINYGFPSQPKVFVHRVGRTARAGRTGWTYNLLCEADIPYLLDLQLFLGKKLVVGRDEDEPSYVDDVTLGTLPRDKIEYYIEIIEKLLESDVDLNALRDVSIRGEKLYLKSRNSPSSESIRRAKDIVKRKHVSEQLHPLFWKCSDAAATSREIMLSQVNSFRPQETVFEIGKRGKNDNIVESIRKRRQKIQFHNDKISKVRNLPPSKFDCYSADLPQEDCRQATAIQEMDNTSEQSGHDVEVIVNANSKGGNANGDISWQDSENFMSYLPKTINLEDEQRYGVHSGSANSSKSNTNFIEAARHATLEIGHDEVVGFADASRMRWNKKSKKYMPAANPADSARGTESSYNRKRRRDDAEFRSGKFEAWKRANKISRLPRVGEKEEASGTAASIQRRYRHMAEKAPKLPDKLRDDYHKKLKKFEAAKEKQRLSSFSIRGKSELKKVEVIQKDRTLKQKRQEKNARKPRTKKM